MTKKSSTWAEIRRGLNGKILAIYGGIILLDHVFWNTIIIYPLKILTVFFHELSHALAAIVTGGKVLEIVLVPEQGGHCLIAGGNGFLVSSAGYLGSLIWGGIILVSAANSRRDKQIMIALGAILIVVSFIWIRPFISFGFIFCIILGGAMIGVGKYLPDKVNDWVLRTVGLTSCLYATLDVKDDTIDRNLQESDAGRLAEIAGMPSLFWGYFWMAMAILGTILFILLASMVQVKGKGNTEGTS
ncbi:MAG: M50 family metallopeptidase, partial [Opitutae bacterium]|nr:M50 family metallopeptidase [Opitutae bacterium]